MIPLAVTIALALAGSSVQPVVSPIPAFAPTSVCGKGSQPLKGNQASTSASSTGGIADLPFAMGRRFATLDDYLAHLECRAGPIDLPWWKQIRPGVYKLMTTATNAQPQTATRAELMKRFGFKR